MLKLSFVCLDTETTGLDDTAEIIEIGMVKVIDGQIADRYSQLVKPSCPIPEPITQLTGIDNEMVEDQPYWSGIEKAVLDFIGDATLVAHNVSFDRGMLENHLQRILPNPWVDTHDMAKIFSAYAHKLQAHQHCRRTGNRQPGLSPRLAGCRHHCAGTAETDGPGLSAGSQHHVPHSLRLQRPGLRVDNVAQRDSN